MRAPGRPSMPAADDRRHVAPRATGAAARRPARRPAARARGRQRRWPGRRAATAAAAGARRRRAPAPRGSPTPTARHARAGAAGSTICIQYIAPKAASATNAMPRASSGGISGASSGSFATRGRGSAAPASARPPRPQTESPSGGRSPRSGVTDGRAHARAHRLERGAAARARGEVAAAAGHLEHRPAAGDLARDHEQLPAGRAAQPARRPVDDARRDEDDEPAAVLRGAQRRAVRPRAAGRGGRARAASRRGRARCGRRGGRRAAAGRSRSAWRSAGPASPPPAPRCRARPAVAAPRGSRTTSGRASASATSLRSMIGPCLARLGQWMREAGEPSACWRRPSISVSAAAVSSARAWAPLVSPPGRGGAHRVDARQHEHLVAARAR